MILWFWDPSNICILEFDVVRDLLLNVAAVAPPNALVISQLRPLDPVQTIVRSSLFLKPSPLPPAAQAVGGLACPVVMGTCFICFAVCCAYVGMAGVGTFVIVDPLDRARALELLEFLIPLVLARILYFV